MRAPFALLISRLLGSTVVLAGMATAVRLGANVMLLPFLTTKLTSSELALWWTYMALGGLANLADFGFGQAISRGYSYLWAGAEDFDNLNMQAPPAKKSHPNWDRLSVFHSSVRSLYGWLGLVGLTLIATVGSLFVAESAPGGRENLGFWLTWGFFAASLAFSFKTSHWALACTGIDRIRELQLANMWGGLAYVITAGLLLTLNLKLWALVAAFALRAVIVRYLCSRTYRGMTLGQNQQRPPELAILRRIWPNAWKFGVLSAGVFLVNSGPVLVCKKYLGDEVTASYGLTAQIGLMIVSMASLWLTVKWPQITIMRTHGRLEELSILYARRLGLSMASFIVAAAITLAFGNLVLEWKGTNTRLLDSPVLIVFFIYLGQQLFCGSFGSLTFTENVVPFYLLSLNTGIAVVILSALGAIHFGIWGFILAPLIVAQFGSTWYPVLRGFKGQSLSVVMFLRAMFGFDRARI